MRYAAVIGALSISFFGYIPAHYNPNYSLMKNNLLGVISLFSNVFMWSFISGQIALTDALRCVEIMVTRTYEPVHIILLLFKVGIVFALLQTLKLIAEELDDICISKR